MAHLASMFATTVTEDFKLACQSVSRPTLPEGGALLSLTGCGLCGSDIEKLTHKKATVGQVLGHEVVGTILELCETYTGPFQVGQRIATSHHVPCLTCQYCLNGAESMCRQFKHTNLQPGGFAEVLALSAGHLACTAFVVPDDISDAAASCVEPFACVVKGVRRGGAIQGKGRVLIVGLGFIGLMAAQLYQLQGVEVIGVDINPERVEFANNSGWFVQACCPKTLPDVMIALPMGVDVVFLTIVLPSTLEHALASVRDGGTIIQFSRSFGEKPSTYCPDTLYYREITVVPSYSPSLIDLKTSAELIFSKQVDFSSLCTHQRSFTSADEALDLYRSGKAIKVMLTPN